jgi:hypothetical protein
MLYYAEGSAILTEEEILEPGTLGRLSAFHCDLAARRTPKSLAFSTGELTVDNVVTGPGAREAAVEWKPIGPGLPLTVMIREVYTGRYPVKGPFSGRKDLLVTSAIKSVAFQGGQPRAVNYLVNGVLAKTRMQRPSASSPGTPVVFYSPALLEKSMTLDLTMVFDTFPQEVFNQIANGLSAAGGIPIFQVYSAYILAAGQLVRILGRVGETIFDGKPVFFSSDALDVFLPGSPPLPAGFRLVTTDNVDSIDKNFRSKYQVNVDGKVVDQAGKDYQGDIPYIVISVDGTLQEELSSFVPSAASTAVMSRFFGIKEGQQQSADIIVDGIKLYNDLVYRHELDRVDGQLKDLPEGDPRKTSLQERRKALAANIMEDLLKPKA